MQAAARQRATETIPSTVKSSISSVSPGEQERLKKRLNADLAFYSRCFLKIRTKEGAITSFVHNDAQEFLHATLEAQLLEKGYARALVLKGRQQGVSTYTASRYYKKTTANKGIRTFILTHDAKATSNLFDIVKRYHDNLPSNVRRKVGTSNQKELAFEGMDSSYHVGTAGSKGIGRSNTIQLFHGSEVAFWKFAEDHAAGALQAVPKAPGTEVILESTANGMGNFFHQQWTKAVAGKSDFIAVFIPWFWQKEYTDEVPNGFSLAEEEIEYMDTYELSLGQMVWRRNKTAELGDPVKFKQEYPATPEEAFQYSGVESYIPTTSVAAARKQTEHRSYGAVVAGFDPSRDGKDRDSSIIRQGRNAFNLEYLEFSTLGERVMHCKKLLTNRSLPIDMLFIDYGGSGWEIGQILDRQGFGERITVVNFGKGASQPYVYANKRAEMWGRMKDWLVNNEAQVSIPDDSQLHADIVAPGFTYDTSTRIILESKKDMKTRGLQSPDGGDALALTFAELVIRDHVADSTGHGVKAEMEYDMFPSRGDTVQMAETEYDAF